MPVVYEQPRKQQATGIALVIGNSAYRFATMLSNPAHDAEDMESAFLRMGFDVVGGRARGIDLDRSSFASCVKEFARRAADYKIVVFYYAGHGIQFSGENYLLPIDANPQSESDINLELIALQPLIANTISGDRTTVVVLDACRNNPFLAPLQRALGTRSVQVRSGLADTPAGENTIIAFATQPNHVAYDGSGRNGVFTDALLSALRRPDRDIEEIMREVRSSVATATQGMSLGKQIPWSHTSLLHRKFSLTGRFEEAAGGKRPEQDAPASQVAPEPPRREPAAHTTAAVAAAPPRGGHSTNVSIGSISNSEIRKIGTVTTVNDAADRGLPPRGRTRPGH